MTHALLTTALFDFPHTYLELLGEGDEWLPCWAYVCKLIFNFWSLQSDLPMRWHDSMWKETKKNLNVFGEFWVWPLPGIQPAPHGKPSGHPLIPKRNRCDKWPVEYSQIFFLITNIQYLWPLSSTHAKKNQHVHFENYTQNSYLQKKKHSTNSNPKKKKQKLQTSQRQKPLQLPVPPSSLILLFLSKSRSRSRLMMSSPPPLMFTFILPTMLRPLLRPMLPDSCFGVGIDFLARAFFVDL